MLSLMVNLEWNSLRYCQLVHHDNINEIKKDSPEVDTIVRVIPESAANDNVALALALLDSKAIGVLAVVSRVAVTIRIKV